MPEHWKAVVDGRSLTLDELKIAADELLRATTRKIWLMHGEMGAGKTTLIKALCESLGVRGGMSSPTFSIVNEYTAASGDIIYHFDFYRLKNETEALDIGLDEYLDSGHYCFLEWPGKVSSLLPAENFQVRIRASSEDTRTIEYLTNE